MVITRIDCERRLVAAPGLGKAAGLAIDDAELVVRDRVVRVDFERCAQVLLR